MSSGSKHKPGHGPDTGQMRQLNALDSMFLYLDTARAPMTVGFLQIYSPEPKEDAVTRFQRLQKHVERCLDTSPVFRRALVRSPLDLDHAWFADDVDLDLSYHVRHYALPQPGTSDQLNDAYARICAQPMDLTRPLWEIHIIEGLDQVEGIPSGAFALVVKFHHAGFDGGAAADMVAALHRTDARRDNTRAPGRRAMPAPSTPTMQSTLQRSAMRYARFGTALGREIAARLPSLAKLVGKRLRQYTKADVRQLLERPYRLIYRVFSERIEIITVLHYRQLMPSDLEGLR